MRVRTPPFPSFAGPPETSVGMAWRPYTDTADDIAAATGATGECVCVMVGDTVSVMGARGC